MNLFFTCHGIKTLCSRIWERPVNELLILLGHCYAYLCAVALHRGRFWQLWIFGRAPLWPSAQLSLPQLPLAAVHKLFTHANHPYRQFAYSKKCDNCLLLTSPTVRAKDVVCIRTWSMSQRSCSIRRISKAKMIKYLQIIYHFTNLCNKHWLLPNSIDHIVYFFWFNRLRFNNKINKMII